jgi:hypothetical protein
VERKKKTKAAMSIAKPALSSTLPNPPLSLGFDRKSKESREWKVEKEKH